MNERPFRELSAYWRAFWQYIASLNVSSEERRQIRLSYERLIEEAEDESPSEGGFDNVKRG